MIKSSIKGKRGIENDITNLSSSFARLCCRVPVSCKIALKPGRHGKLNAYVARRTEIGRGRYCVSKTNGKEGDSTVGEGWRGGQGGGGSK